MKIVNDTEGHELDGVVVYLSPSEAREMAGALKRLIEKCENQQPKTVFHGLEINPDHYHLSSKDFQKELTICVVNDGETIL